MTKRLREGREKEPILVWDVMKVILSFLEDDPVTLLSFLQCQKEMFSLVKPHCLEIILTVETLLVSVVIHAVWPDSSNSTVGFKAFVTFLRYSWSRNIGNLYQLYKENVPESCSKTVFILSLMKRAILEEKYIFTTNIKGKRVNRFSDNIHHATRLKNIYWIDDSTKKEKKKCKPILETEIKVAPDLDENNSFIVITNAIHEVKCPIQRELLTKYYQHTNPKTEWEKMKYAFTLTGNKQRIRKPLKNDCISRVVLRGEMDRFRYVHIEPYMRNYFVFVGDKKEASIALRLNTQRDEDLLKIEKALSTLLTDNYIDLTI